MYDDIFIMSNIWVIHSHSSTTLQRGKKETVISQALLQIDIYWNENLCLSARDMR